ncbi:DNA mismatch endonuclease Vsr [Agrobacterium radiobacter]|uniref:very short patch repair endonuclease n=1 Tax=Agrobacterium radiobacter TaxID=362 RepID=UPI0034248305
MTEMDTRSAEQRRRIMQAVKHKDTKPEVVIRQALHALGYRYRLHDRALPGRPDIVFPSRKKVIFINGCFWHGHDCPKGRLPKTRPDYWGPKIAANRARDEAVIASLGEKGWDILTVWQCQMRNLETTLQQIARFLGPSRPTQISKTAAEME